MSDVLQHMAWNALEASLLAAAILLLTWLRTPSAPVRHALWLLVAVKLLLPPIGIPVAGLRDGLRSVAGGIATPRVDPGLPEAPLDDPPVREDVPRVLVEEDDNEAAFLSADDETGAAGAREVVAVMPVATVAPAAAASGGSLPVDVGAAAAALWITGAVILLHRRARRLFALRALFRTCCEAPADVTCECTVLAARLGIRKPPRVLVAPWAPSPFLSGAGTPVIVLPACLLEPAGRGAVPAVLAHELGHLKRRDHWASWVDFLATTVFWWLPTAWIAGRAMERASDEAADACAARALGSRKSYARSLIETLEVLNWNHAPFAIPGRGLGEKEAVERRLVMVLRHPLFTELTLRSRIALVALGLFVLPAAASQAPGQGEPPAEQIAAEPGAPAGLAAPSAAAAPVALPAPQAAPGIAAPSADEPGIAAPAVDEPAVAQPRAGSSRAGRRRTGGSSYGLATSDSAPRGFEERLSDVEKKVDRLLQEMEKLTGTGAPGKYGTRSSRMPTPGRDDWPDPRPAGTRAAARAAAVGTAPPGKTPATVPAPVGPARSQSQRLKQIERRFEERARALRKQLADLEAALEDEMKAAIESEPGDSSLEGIEAAPSGANVPGSFPVAPGGSLHDPEPVTPRPAQPVQPPRPAQPAAAPVSPARN